MQEVDRVELLGQLESVSPGLASREIIEQSSCFVFGDGKVQTFNDEVAVTSSCCLKVDGAVPADPLVKLLRRLDEKKLQVDVGDGELLIKGKGRRSGIRMEAKVLLPVDVVEEASEWKQLADGFLEALSTVIQCVGHDESMFVCTCVHIQPEWLEGSDNYQVIRYPIKTGVQSPSLVRRESLRHIISLGIDSLSETENWIHFRNKGGVVCSCRRFVEQYPDIGAILDISGSRVKLPVGIESAVSKAQVFSDENSIDSDTLRVELRPGKMQLEGRGPDGWHIERMEVEYSDVPIRFTIAPKLLLEVVKRGYSCEVSEGRLKISGDHWNYVTCLGTVKETV